METLAPDRKLIIPAPLLSLIGSCCVVCVPECCGIDAYEISAIHIAAWIDKHGVKEAQKAAKQLDDLIDWASKQKGQIWSDGQELNAIWTQNDCIKYLEKWRQEINLALCK